MTKNLTLKRNPLEVSKFFLNSPEPDNFEKILSGFQSFDSREMYTFHQNLKGYSPTPLLSLDQLANELGLGKIWLKYDAGRFNLNAFKGLGASYAIYKYLQQHPERAKEKDLTFCTATDGNHGRAVAWAAKVFGKQAVIFVPNYTVEERIENIRQQNARVVVVDGTYDEAVRLSAQQAEKNHWIIVQDTAWENYTQIPEWIMAGYQTTLMEMEKQLLPPEGPLFSHTFLQAGVGSWPASMLLYFMKRYKEKMPRAVCVEPLAADGILESAIAGKVSTSKGSGITQMAGLNCGTPSMTAFPVLKSACSAFLAIPDHYAEEAIKALYKIDPKIIAGESGAAGLAGLIAVCREEKLLPLKESLQLDSTSEILIIVTEGATDRMNFERIIK